jgi:hypothetical protein
MIIGVPLFKKANKKSSEALIPIYNLYVLLKIVQLPQFNFLVFLFPVFNIVLIIYIEYKLHKLFFTSKGFFIGMIFLPFVFLPMLAFGKYKYKQKPLTKEEEENSEVQTSPLLLTEEEMKKMNEVQEEPLDVDSIFKSDVALIEEVEPYKAAKARDIYQNDGIYEEEPPKNEVKKDKIIEEVEVIDLDEKKKKDDDEKIEIIDL